MCVTQTLLLIRKLNAFISVSLHFCSHGNNYLQRTFNMVKVSFNKALGQKDPKKESLITDVQDPESAVLVRQQSKVWCFCFCLGLALVISGIVVGGAYLYRYYVIEKPDNVSFIEDDEVELFKVPVPEFTDMDPAGILDDYTIEKEMFLYGMKYVEDDIELNGEVKVGMPLRLIEETVCFYQDDEVELIKVPVPDFRDSDPAIILHDFKMRLTAYLDLNLDTCYIITLNTSIVMLPRYFQEFLDNIEKKMYLPQSYLVREEMMVTEKLDSTSDLGKYIIRLCSGKDMYRLQRRDTILGMQKREALNCHKIRHFENKFVVETLICEP